MSLSNPPTFFRRSRSVVSGSHAAQLPRNERAPGLFEALEHRRLLSSAPVADAGGPYEIFEGQQLDLDAGLSTDVDGDITTYTWSINGQQQLPSDTGPERTITWGELVSMGLGDGTASWDLAVTVVDSDGNTDTDQVTLTVKNAPPVGRFSVTPEPSFSEGRDVLVEAWVHSDFNSAPTSQYDYRIELWLDGSMIKEHEFTGLGIGGSLLYTLPDAGELEVRAWVTDHENATAPATLSSIEGDDLFAVTVADVLPVFQSISPAPVGAVEGSPVNVGAAFTTASVDTVTYTWVLARHNGTSFVTEQVVEAGEFTQLTPENDGQYAFQVRATDDDGNIAVSPARLFTVGNVAPVAAGVSGAPAGSVEIGEEINLLASATDAGINDVLTYHWTINGVAQAPSASPAVSFNAVDGVNTYSVVVTDDSGATSNEISGSFSAEAAGAPVNVAFSGQQHVTTGSNGVANITLRATLTEEELQGFGITSTTSIADAQVEFVVVHPVDGFIYSQTVGVTPNADGTSGVATTTFSYSPTDDHESLTVQMRVIGGGYAESEVTTSLTVSRDDAGLVLGAGTFKNLASGGALPAKAGTNTTFVFAAARDGDSGVTAGTVNLTYRGADNRSYLITSTSVSSLFTWSEDGLTHASMSAKVNVYDISFLFFPKLVESGLTLEMTLTDGPLADSISFAIWDTDTGSLFFGSHVDDNNSVVSQVINGGEIYILDL